MEFNTSLLHGKSVSQYDHGATLPPVSQVSAFGADSMETLEKIFGTKMAGFAYTRIGNPSVAAFEQRINEIEGGLGAVAVASGMSAISLTLLNILSAGDEVIASEGLYGGTVQLFNSLKNIGITVKTVQSLTPEFLEQAYTPQTRAVFGEIISNPSLQILDLKKAADWAHSKSLPLIVDNTTATPFLVRPFEFGADIIIHSSSKYINGSSNSISGVIIDSGKFKWTVERYPVLTPYIKFGPFAFTVRLRQETLASYGSCLSPFNAYLNIIGLETLGLRMERICNNTYALAKALSKIPGISVNYPLLNDTQASLAKSQFKGFGGGILTFRAGSREKAFAIINSLKYATIASNVGDVRTLVIAPATTLYIHTSKDEMNRAGVFEDTVRVSVGIENADDLISDFTQAIQNGGQK